MGEPQVLGAADDVAVGDVTADGIADVVVGLERDGGSVTIYSGSGAGPQQGQRYTQDSPGIPGHVEGGDKFGASVAVVDANRDKFLDVAVGSPGENVGRTPDGGQVTVLLASANGLGAAGAFRVDQTRAGVPDRPRRFGRFGLALEKRDVDGRGRPELVVYSRYDARDDGDRDWDTALTVLFHPLRNGPAWDLRNIPNVCC